MGKVCFFIKPDPLLVHCVATLLMYPRLNSYNYLLHHNPFFKYKFLLKLIFKFVNKIAYIFVLSCVVSVQYAITNPGKHPSPQTFIISLAFKILLLAF
jgi:hypothetical protein